MDDSGQDACMFNLFDTERASGGASERNGGRDDSTSSDTEEIRRVDKEIENKVRWCGRE